MLLGFSLGFSVDDQHYENTIISDYLPYVVDWETPFSLEVQGKATATGVLKLEAGAIFPQGIINRGIPEKIKQISSAIFDKSKPLRIVAPDRDIFLAGFKRTLEVMAQTPNNELLLEIIEKLPKDARVRCIPLSTEHFMWTRTSSIDSDGSFKSLLQETIEDGVLSLHQGRLVPKKDKLIRLRDQILIYLNMGSVDHDFAGWNIPRFDKDAHTGDVFDSMDRKLVWDEDKARDLLKEVIQHKVNRGMFYSFNFSITNDPNFVPKQDHENSCLIWGPNIKEQFFTFYAYDEIEKIPVSVIKGLSEFLSNMSYDDRDKQEVQDKIKTLIINFFVEKTLELCNQAKEYTPVQDTKDRLRQLGKEYREKGRIEDCTLYKENIGDVEHFFDVIAKWQAEYKDASTTTPIAAHP
jgi:hypothetical protein